MANDENLIHLTSETAKIVGAKGGKAKLGRRHINTWVQEILNDEDFEAEFVNNKGKIEHFKGAPIKAIVKAQAIKAVNGDTKAYDSLVKSGWVAKQEIEHSGSVDAQPYDLEKAAKFAEFLKQETKEK